MAHGLGTLNPPISLFTDGSAWAKDKSGGWAWLAVDCEDGYAEGSGSASNTTNNRMEMQAWIEGLTALAVALGPCEVLVWSDSEYVGLGVKNQQRLRHANSDLWISLDAAVAQHEYVEFVHVKGHSKERGHALNARVDKMAGNARRQGRDEREVGEVEPKRNKQRHTKMV